MKRCLMGILFLFCLPYFSKSQNTHQNTAWFVYSHNQKISDKWSIGAEFQLRTAHDYNYVKGIVFKPIINYSLNKKLSLGVGYIYQQNYLRPVITKSRLNENAIWEQVAYNAKFNSISVLNRFRLEQRFIEQLNDNIFSERLRYTLQLQIPLQKLNDQKFEKVFYLGIQNEVFFNIQHKKQLNNHFFDQNRAYLSLGYRFSPSVDLESGYLNQSLKNKNDNYTINDVAEVILKTRFGTRHHLH
ncbi:MAG: DUF2490 domain-containing protein [Pelobium sp.]